MIAAVRMGACLALSAVACFASSFLIVQPVRAAEQSSFEGLEWRFTGPMRGGRVNAVAGHPDDKNTFYAGYTGGGVWKSDDAGVTWRNVSDGYFGVGSVGALAIAESEPDIVYAGTGEHALRGDISHGDGVYKSLDGGETWRNVGLAGTRQIAEIIVHPANPDVVYVAALGSFTGPNEERGVYRSTDGGETWARILFVSPDAGAIEIEMDRINPEIMFAASWDVRRFPWGIRSAGVDSRIFRSRDGGDSWQDISAHPGLPSGAKEKIGLGLSDAQSGRIWALVSGEGGRGVYRSDDYGDTWALTVNHKKLLARTYYFNHMTADPQDPQTVYILNDRLWRSTDGGVTFDDLPHNHADHHDLWIDPQDNTRIIDGSDGGAEISFNRGQTWSTLFNQPTGQFYTLTIDDEVPYNLYGAQQDWSTIGVPSRHRAVRGASGFYDLGFSEAGRVAIDQRDPDIFYISDHHWLLRYNKSDGGVQYAGPRDETNYGWGAADIKYRFNWTFPVLASQHDNKTLFAGSQYLHISQDGGQTWREASPDLTRADPDTLEKTPLPGAEDASNREYWGPLTRDSNGDHWFATLYTISESPLKKGLIWTGSDDGVVQVTRNGGRNWANVTPPGMPAYAMVTNIEASPNSPGTAYVTASAYKVDNTDTLVFRTRDFGASWTKVTTGLPENEIMRSIAADPDRSGLIYAGGETGIYVSHNEGDSWASLQLNLPVVPIYDLKVKGDDLAIATHGRGFWILDDLSVLRQHTLDETTSARLYTPEPATRWSGFWWNLGSAPAGLVIHYRLPSPADDLRLEIRDGDDALVVSADLENGAISNQAGLNRVIWNFRYPNARRVPGVVTRGNQEVGPKAVPGKYSVDLIVDGEVHSADAVIVKDARSEASLSDLKAQFELLSKIRNTLDRMNATVINVRAVSEKISTVMNALDADDGLYIESARLNAALKDIERRFVQVNAQARKDLHANPVMLNDKFYRLSNFVSRVEAKPTPTQQAMYNEFSMIADDKFAEYDGLISTALEDLNRSLADRGFDAIIVSDDFSDQSEGGEQASMPF